MSDDVDRYRENFTDEVNAAYLYRVAAELEEDEVISGVYVRLADTEEKHAQLWREKLEVAGVTVPSSEPDARSRILAWLARRMGPGILTR